MNTLQEEWDHTNRHLEWLNERFIFLHEKSSKDWSDLEKSITNEYRQGAIITCEYRYWILERAINRALEYYFRTVTIKQSK